MVLPALSHTDAPWIEPEESWIFDAIRAGSTVQAIRPDPCATASAALAPASPCSARGAFLLPLDCKAATARYVSLDSGTEWLTSCLPEMRPLAVAAPLPSATKRARAAKNVAGCFKALTAYP